MSEFELINGKIYKDGLEDSLTSSAIDQISFLGASVISVTATIGWNGTRSSCTIDLAEDWADGEVFELPITGTPKFFKILDTSGNKVWEFNGLVKNVTRSVGPTSGRVFSVTLESPEVVLEAAAIVIEKYPGEGFSRDAEGNNITPFSDKTYNWDEVYNVINVLGFWENDQYGVDGASFGKADINESGIPWLNMIIALDEIINRLGRNPNNLSLPDRQLELGGSLAYSSTSYTNGRPYFYAVNFDDLMETLQGPEVQLTNEYRVGGGGSITEIIQDLCTTANCQWLVTLEENLTEVKSPYNGENVDAIIKITAVSLNRLPDIGIISDFGLAKEGKGKDISLVGALSTYLETDADFIDMAQGQLGLELADITTGKIVLGGPKTRMIEHTTPTTYMYWGNMQSDIAAYEDIPIITKLLSPTSNLDIIPVDLRSILGTNDVGVEEKGREYYLDATETLPQTVSKGIYYISMLELRSAANDQESWENYLTYFRQKKSRDLRISGDLRKLTVYDANTGAENLSYFGELKANKEDTAFDQQNLNREIITNTSDYSQNKDNDIINQIWAKIRDLYENYYGKEYIVPVPVSAYKWEPDSRTFISEWEITDSAFTDDTSGPNAPDFDIKFAHDSGRTVAYVGFPLSVTVSDASGLRIGGNLDFSEFDGKDTTIIGNRVYIKSTVDTSKINIAFPIPITFTGNTSYGDKFSNIGYRHPQILTGGTNSDLNNSKPTSSYYGFYSDIRGAIPFARVTLPGKARYMKQAIGLSHDFDGIGMIAEFLFKAKSSRGDRSSSETVVGADRVRSPIAEGFYHPELVSVPLKSNRFHYGPWLPLFNPNIAGKVEVDIDTGLVPENFVIPGFGLGNVGLDYFGMSKAGPDRVGHFVNENGTFTLAGVSKLKIGEKLVKGGPYVTDVNISIDATAGLQTIFTMKTWSLDFGKIKKHYLERFKKISQASIREAKILRKRQQETSDFALTINKRFSPADRFRSHSSSSIIAGIVQETKRTDIDDSEKTKDIKAVSVSIMPSHNFISTVKNDYDGVGGCSLDSFFTPFTCDFEHSGLLPKIEESPNELFGTHVNLNPLFPRGVTDGSYKFYARGTNKHMVVRGTGIPTDMNMKYASLETGFESEDEFGIGGLDIRSVGNATPNIVVGYGYDVNGIKVPNSDDGHLNVNDYKAGPDTKVWDDYKKTWIGDFPIMKGLLMDEISSSNAASISIQTPLKVEVLRYVTEDTPGGNYDSSGVYQNNDSSLYTIVGAETLYIEDPALTEADKGAFVLYVNIDGRNTPVRIACAASVANLLIVQDNE